MVKYIVYQGKKYPVRVSFLALSKTQEEIKSNVFDGENFDLKSLEPLLYYSLDAGHHFEGKKFEINRSEIAYMLDECFKEFVEIVTEFNSPQNDEVKTDESKKKAE